jgi:hypothetical protein
MGGTPFLFAPVSPPVAFRDNVNVQVLPLAGAKDVGHLLASNRYLLGITPDISLDAAERRTLSGREVAYFRYHGRFPGQPAPLRFLCVLYPEGETQVVITATVLEERWAAAGSILEKSFAGISIEGEPASGPTSRALR